MIARYSRKELTSIWSEENKYKIWLDVEVAAAEAFTAKMHCLEMKDVVELMLII